MDTFPLNNFLEKYRIAKKRNLSEVTFNMKEVDELHFVLTELLLRCNKIETEEHKKLSLDGGSMKMGE